MHVSFDYLLQVRLPTSMVERARALATEHQQKLSELVREALREHLDRREA